jgi:hypothetical protein
MRRLDTAIAAEIEGEGPAAGWRQPLFGGTKRHGPGAVTSRSAAAFTNQHRSTTNIA